MRILNKINIQKIFFGYFMVKEWPPWEEDKRQKNPRKFRWKAKKRFLFKIRRLFIQFQKCKIIFMNNRDNDVH